MHAPAIVIRSPVTLFQGQQLWRDALARLRIGWPLGVDGLALGLRALRLIIR
jgi:hypothetical protein